MLTDTTVSLNMLRRKCRLMPVHMLVRETATRIENKQSLCIKRMFKHSCFHIFTSFYNISKFFSFHRRSWIKNYIAFSKKQKVLSNDDKISWYLSYTYIWFKILPKLAEWVYKYIHVQSWCSQSTYHFCHKSGCSF